MVGHFSKKDDTAKVRVAIPEPCSYDLDYSSRAMPRYLAL